MLKLIKIYLKKEFFGFSFLFFPLTLQLSFSFSLSFFPSFPLSPKYEYAIFDHLWVGMRRFVRVFSRTRPHLQVLELKEKESNVRNTWQTRRRRKENEKERNGRKGRKGRKLTSFMKGTLTFRGLPFTNPSRSPTLWPWTWGEGKKVILGRECGRSWREEGTRRKCGENKQMKDRVGEGE